MTKEREALRMALEAWQTSTYGTVQHHKAMLAAMTEVGKAALAQPEQEPVAWTLTEELEKRQTTTKAHLWFSNPVNCMWTPLYTSPPKREWVGLTDDHLRELGFSTRPRWWAVLEVKLKELNA